MAVACVVILSRAKNLSCPLEAIRPARHWKLRMEAKIEFAGKKDKMMAWLRRM
jgi:hypothetical protein